MLLHKLLFGLFPHSVWRINPEKPAIYLTFDDGVHPQTTPPLLEMLDRFQAKATFFCIGKNVERYPHLYDDIIKAGHTVGNHTYSHLNGFRTGLKEYLDDVRLAAEYIPGNLFRPPYGRITPAQYRALKNQYRIVFWSRLSWDFDPALSPEKCYGKVRKATPGDIIVFHDSVKAFSNMAYALPKLLDEMKKMGVDFATLK